MKQRGKCLQITVMCIMLFMIILDTRTAASAVQDAIILCCKSVIPGVFPFLFLGGALAMVLGNINLAPLERILHIPSGTAGYFLTGLVCGYPVGAKNLQDAVCSGVISKKAAARMICFCNNASPAFIIGILSPLFSSPIVGIAMWMIQITASLMLGVIMPFKKETIHSRQQMAKQSIGSVMMQAISAMGSICGWVILFKVLISYIMVWLPVETSGVGQVLVCGLLELTNGILALPAIHTETLRYIASAVLLSFGGFCVYFQTKSVAPDTCGKKYLCARLLHGAISSLLAAISSCFIFHPDNAVIKSIPLLLCIVTLGAVLFCFNEKSGSIQRKVVV